IAVSVSLAEPGIESRPFAKTGHEPAGDTLFTLLKPEETGISLTIPIDTTHPLKRAYHSSSACGAVGIADLNLDGKQDIYAGNGPGNNALYLQTGPLKFEDVAEKLGVTGDDAWGVGVCLADFDNDGDFDIYVCNYDAPNQLFVNLLIDGGQRSDTLRFEERAAQYGLDIADGSVVSAFADYDRDGDLDMYLLTHQIYRDGGRPSEPIRIYEKNGQFKVEEKYQRWYEVEQGKRGDNGEFLYTESGRPDYLFRNDGEAGFTNVTAEAGIHTERAWGNSSTWWDYNNDSWPDLYVGNDFKSPDYLYRNNGDGTFTEVSKEHFRHTTWFSMGAVQSDFNNDGLFDFVIADMMPRTHYMQKASMASMASRSDELENVDGVNQLMRNTFHINSGTDQFIEGAWLADIAHTEWTWAIRSGDFDNDGLPDLFFCNGVPRQFNHSDLPPINHQTLVGNTSWDHYESAFGGAERREQNMAFKNKGDFQFEDVSAKWGLDHVSMSYGASLCDLDGDGRLDLLTSNLEDPLSVYLNTGTEGNRIVVELKSTQGNLQGVGALVSTETPDGQTRSRQFFPYGGFLDADEPVIHIGLGDQEKVANLHIEWPSGQVQNFKDLDVNQHYTVTEPAEPAEKREPVKTRKPENTMFTKSETLDGFRHVEEEFDDFDRQPLMLLKLSQLGPGQAWGDIDGDGDADLYLGGAAGQPGQIFRNRTEEGSNDIQLLPDPAPAFSLDAMSEDMGAAFIDADGDGDLDLYVASGGVECEPGDEVLRDRLYLNDGEGNFKHAADDAVPDVRESSSVVAPADFDHDGDLDLFVGTRSIPGDYPATPQSVLLINEGGKFTVADEKAAPGLQKCGLVCGAIWSDVDNDGWIDLMVTTDWGPVRLFRNQEGNLIDDTSGAGLDGPGLATIGWWSGIDGRDIDNDGDIDFVVGNMGRNTRYQPSLDSPELLFYGDFDNSGKNHIVEARFMVEKGEQICYPWAGFMEAGMAMPYIADEMVTFDKYAKLPLTGIYDIKKLENSMQLKANRMDASVLLNDGEGHFDLVPLPVLAQVSPSYGIVLRDVDLDGRTDCYVVHNIYSVTDEVGEMATGISQLMRGTGDAKNPFEPIFSRESGLEVPGDAKSLAAVDLNRDGLEDFVVGINNDDPDVFVNTPRKENANRPLRIQLAGDSGNPQAIGARVTVSADSLPPQTAEVSGGGSYLTQSDPTLVFAVPKEAKTVKLKIRWPDGKTQESSVDATSRTVTLKRM
ncbi:MAG: VCBS repeat-containing protein, partial [Verrucomicrobiae bacterium]|nr:VCBS repeat-containing protein [Verrucomicrobiae bacterium]